MPIDIDRQPRQTRSRQYRHQQATAKTTDHANRHRQAAATHRSCQSKSTGNHDKPDHANIDINREPQKPLIMPIDIDKQPQRTLSCQYRHRQATAETTVHANRHRQAPVHKARHPMRHRQPRHNIPCQSTSTSTYRRLKRPRTKRQAQVVRNRQATTTQKIMPIDSSSTHAYAHSSKLNPYREATTTQPNMPTRSQSHAEAIASNRDHRHQLAHAIGHLAESESCSTHTSYSLRAL